jgi:hypothetical protein
MGSSSKDPARVVMRRSKTLVGWGCQACARLRAFLQERGLLEAFEAREQTQGAANKMIISIDRPAPGPSTYPELRRARQAIYLQALAETGNMQVATQRAGVDRSLPAHWRRRYPAFATAEQRAWAQAAQRLQERLQHGEDAHRS